MKLMKKKDMNLKENDGSELEERNVGNDIIMKSKNKNKRKEKRNVIINYTNYKNN